MLPKPLPVVPVFPISEDLLPSIPSILSIPISRNPELISSESHATWSRMLTLFMMSLWRNTDVIARLTIGIYAIGLYYRIR